MNRTEKVVYIVLMLIGIGLTLAFGLWWFQLEHIPNNFSGWLHIFDVIAFALLTYVVWYQIIYELFSWAMASLMEKPPKTLKPEKGLRVALLTAFVPGKEPYDVLENSLKAMVAVDYDHDTWVLDEGDDETTKALCAKYGVIHYSRKGKEQYNTEEGKFKAKTKAGNYNSWFVQYSHNYDIVAQHDVDFIPSKDFFQKTLGYFRDPKVAFVGTPQIYGNKNDSWIARGAAEQAYAFYGQIQRGLHGGFNMSLFIGANHLVRVTAHDDIEGYSGHIVEDHLTGMKFYAKKWKSVYVPKILAVGEGPSTWDSYFSQQMRWAYGLMDILFRHSPAIFTKMRKVHILNYFLLQQYYFYGLAQALGIFLMGLYFVFGFQSTAMAFMPLLYLYLPLLVFQIVVFLWLQRFNIDPQEEKGFLWRGRILALAAWPIYLMAFVGVVIGRKLTYAITPKGGAQVPETHHSLFIPHFILGTLSAASILASFTLGHTAPQILFWAFVNTIVMYGFCLAVIAQPNYREYLQRKAKRYLPQTALAAAAVLVIIMMPKDAILQDNTATVLHSEDTKSINHFVQLTEADLVNFEPVPEAEVASSDFNVEEVLATMSQVSDEIVFASHVVEEGESLRYIAKLYDLDETDWTKIVIDRNPDLIYPGDVAIVPITKSL